MDDNQEERSVHLAVYRVNWCPKRRREVLVGPTRVRLEQVIGEAAAEHGWEILRLATLPEHIYAVHRSNLATQTADISRQTKGCRSHLLREQSLSSA